MENATIFWFIGDGMERLEGLLTGHLPYSLPLLRSIQFTEEREGLDHSVGDRLLFVTDNNAEAERFTAAFVDFSAESGTQMWLYCTLEDNDEEEQFSDLYRAQMSELIHQVDEMSQGKAMVYPGGLLLGSIHTRVRKILAELGRVCVRNPCYYDKWIFRACTLVEDDQLPLGMSWDEATMEDCHVAVTRTDIPRTPSVFRISILRLFMSDSIHTQEHVDAAP